MRVYIKVYGYSRCVCIALVSFANVLVCVCAVWRQKSRIFLYSTNTNHFYNKYITNHTRFNGLSVIDVVRSLHTKCCCFEARGYARIIVLEGAAALKEMHTACFSRKITSRVRTSSPCFFFNFSSSTDAARCFFLPRFTHALHCVAPCRGRHGCQFSVAIKNIKITFVDLLDPWNYEHGRLRHF